MSTIPRKIIARPFGCGDRITRVVARISLPSAPKTRNAYSGRVAEYQMILNEAGRTIQRRWEDLPQWFPTIVLDVFQLMPNRLQGSSKTPRIAQIWH
jgi:hypothetical protein